MQRRGAALPGQGPGRPPGILSLVRDINAYGEAIHFDLLGLGRDIYDYFRRRRPWRELQIVLRRLPSSSQYVAARRNDPEYAEWVASLPDEAKQSWAPSSSEWDLLCELTAAVYDRLGELITLTANVNRAKDASAQKPPPRFPRPVTEIDRARARAEARIEDELDNLIAAAHATWSAEQRGEG